MLKRYAEIALDVAIGSIAYYFLSWIGLALWAFFVIGNYLYQIGGNQKIMMNTLLSRLPDRCAMCHREIVDEGGVGDADGIYHDACWSKLESLEVPASKATNE